MSPARAQKKEKQYDLKVPEIREKLRRHLQDKQDDLTVSTTQAAKIVGTTPSKLRKWDQEGLFPVEQRSPTDESADQRRYNLRELARSLIIQELLQQHPDLKAVAAFMQENAQVINALINDIISSGTNQALEQPWKIKKRLVWAEEAYFWRMFVPRALYLSMRLLHEHTPDNDTWLFFPLAQKGMPEAERSIQSIEQLAEMGEILLGYCSSEHPFFMCIPQNPILDLPGSYKVIPIEWPLEDTSRPVGVHLILEEKRWKTSSKSMQRGAALLLRLLQETQSQWQPYLQKGNDAMTYYAPEFDKALPGHQILNKIADQVIQLGGIDKASQRQRWHFCCILLSRGDEIRLPLKQHHLVVQGVGGVSPYDINKKALAPNENSISMLAYHSRQITYRHNIVDEEPDIASHDQEKDIKSAIAVPIEGKERDWRTVHPLGVLYVASREVDAFSTDDDLLLLRMMGKLISEQVMSYQMRTLLVDEFAEMVRHPGIVDDYFKEFLSDNLFIRHLEEWLKQIQSGHNADSPSDGEPQPFHDLTFIAVNLSMHNHKTDARTTEVAIRNLTRELGKRIKRWARGKSGHVEVYYMHNECYYLILRDIPLEQTASSAFDLQSKLHRYIKHHAQQHGFKSVQVPGLQLHLGVVGYTYDKLQELLTRISPGTSMRVRITNLLNDALSVSKDLGENNIAIWQPQDEKFVSNMDELTADNSLLQNEQLTKQVADTMYSQVVNEIYERFKRENPQR